jgi:hypothetical protein
MKILNCEKTLKITTKAMLRLFKKDGTTHVGKV